MSDSKIRWTAKGRKLGDDPSPEMDINIMEEARSYSMDDGKLPYGLPVDAPMAVTLIKNLWTEVEERAKDPNSFTEWMTKLLRASFALGLDKNILLKTLSQPKCEGIRFYLALKTDEQPGAQGTLTVVTVGVDDKGQDLLYENKPGTPVQDIQTRSLVAEYGYPPGVTQADQPASMDPFVLFNYTGM